MRWADLVDKIEQPHMGRIGKYLELPASQQRRVVKTALLLVAFRLGLWLIPYRILRRWADVPKKPVPSPSPDERTNIGRNIVSIARFIPEATCLTQALAAHVLLRQEGFDPKLQIGVARDQQGVFKAHAWIECDGNFVVGEFNETLRYATMHPVGGLAHTSPAAAAAAGNSK
ncbi:MAG TPA: lasso peptide biosynthesis B2 protein [Tepidisphaeraceae bacterium]|nr:lasso peptide biosynthesis B2 protein [Tepidisphaeraceae bacterium]